MVPSALKGRGATLSWRAATVVTLQFSLTVAYIHRRGDVSQNRVWILSTYYQQCTFWTLPYSGKFSWVQYSTKCCTCFRRIFPVYFHVSMMRQLTTPVSHFSARPSRQWKIGPVANFLQARRFLAMNSGPAIPVGLVAFHHRLNRKPQRESPPFAFCTYARWVECPLRS